MGLVAIRKCNTYDKNLVTESVSDIFAVLGGIDKIIRPGYKVIIKPNLVMAKNPDSAATTHPLIVETIAHIAAKAGGDVSIVDSPGGINSSRILKYVYTASGMEEAAKNAQVKLSFDTRGIDIGNPFGKLLKNTHVLKCIEDADVIINVPKMKTHGMMVYTGAVKNMFGAVPGVLKADYHLRLSKYNDFADALIDIFLSVKPEINILDAVVSMEGRGPTGGNPRETGLLLGSTNAFELDFIAAYLMGASYSDIPVLKQAHKRGFITGKLEDIDIDGPDCRELVMKDYDIPSISSLRSISFFDKGIIGYALKFVRPRPVFSSTLCRSCGECAASCPAKVITMHDGLPEVDLDNCIRCFCCQELCPAAAVEIKRFKLL